MTDFPTSPVAPDKSNRTDYPYCSFPSGFIHAVTKPKLLAMGVSCVDVFPGKGEMRAGGEALNIAAHLSHRTDVDVYLRSHIGDDLYGDHIRAQVRHLGIHDRLSFEPGSTAHHIIKNRVDGDRYFEEGAWHGGVAGNLTLMREDEVLLDTVDAVFMTLWDPNLRTVVQRQERVYATAVDCNEQRDFQDWTDVMPEIDALFSSADQSTVKDFKARSEDSDQVFVLTFGAEGSLAFHRGQRFECPAEPVMNALDTTGCGDCYQAHFIAEWIRNRDVASAMREASLRSAAVTQYVGGFPQN